MGALEEKDELTEGERVRLHQLTELQRRKRIVAREPNGYSQHQNADHWATNNLNLSELQRLQLA